MSVKIEAPKEAFDRRDMFQVLPEYIAAECKLNGRVSFDDASQGGHLEEDVAQMVRSYEQPDINGNPQGQLEPVQVRKISGTEGKPLQLVLGYRRYWACVAYNAKHPDAPMKLKCIVVTINDEEAFRRNIVENRVRKACSPIDDAYNQDRLRTGFGWIDARIAEFYEITPAYVSQLKKLLTLPTKTQQLVHGKKLSFEAAILMADLPADEQEKVLTELQTEGNLGTKNVKGKVRKAKQKKGKSLARTMSDMRDYFEGLTGPAEKDSLRALACLMISYCQGKNSDDEMTADLGLLFDVYGPQPVEETAEPTPTVDSVQATEEAEPIVGTDSTPTADVQDTIPADPVASTEAAAA